METLKGEPPEEAPSEPSRGPIASIRLRTWLLGGGALLLALLGFRYFTNADNQGSEQHAAPAAPVRVATVERRDMAVIEPSLGTVIANTFVQVVPRVSGTLERQFFREGQFVNPGDRLFEIDPRPFQAALQQAEANYRRDEAQLNAALLNKQRVEILLAEGFASPQARDTAVANADTFVATVAADRAAIDLARLNLGYATIRSPVEGKTGPVLVQPGNMVTGGAGSGATLVTIAQIRPVKVSFTLPESDLPKIQARQRQAPLTVSLDVRTAAGDLMTAPVVFTSNAVNAQSGTIELRASFPNTDLLLVPGQLVNVVVQLDTLANALVVPRDAVNDSPTGPYVFVIRSRHAARQPVTVLFDDGANDAVAGALAAGDQVVTEGQLRVTPGAAVRVAPSNDHGAAQRVGLRGGQ